MARAAARMRALDIVEPQVLLHYGGKDEEFTWHLRFLLRRIGEGPLWVMVSPAVVMDVKDLSTHRQFQALGARGAAFVEEDPVFVEEVEDSDLEAFLANLSSATDQRIRRVHMKGDRRLRSLVESIYELTEAVIPDGSQHCDGPRVCLEFLQAVEGAGGFTAFENDWSRQSGIALSSSGYHGHRSLIETLRLTMEVDPLAARNLLTTEYVVHRLAQIEIAVERTPQHPDFTGLSELVGSSATASGGASVRKFRGWISTRQRDRARIMTRARLECEETRHVVPRTATLGGNKLSAKAKAEARALAKKGEE